MRQRSSQVNCSISRTSSLAAAGTASGDLGPGRILASLRGAPAPRLLWGFRGLLWSVRVPFIFLGAMGYDAARMEQSALGKLVKVLVGTSALLTILNYLSWLKEAKALLGIE